MNKITLLGLSILLIWCLRKILVFVNINQQYYDPYLLFYLLIAILLCLLPLSLPTV
jgi:hypothetical protein